MSFSFPIFFSNYMRQKIILFVHGMLWFEWMGEMSLYNFPLQYAIQAINAYECQKLITLTLLLEVCTVNCVNCVNKPDVVRI